MQEPDKDIKTLKEKFPPYESIFRAPIARQEIIVRPPPAEVWEFRFPTLRLPTISKKHEILMSVEEVSALPVGAILRGLIRWRRTYYALCLVLSPATEYKRQVGTFAISNSRLD